MTPYNVEEIIKRHFGHLQEKIANQLTYPKVILEINNGRRSNTQHAEKAVQSLDEVLPIIDTEFRNLIEELDSLQCRKVGA